MDGFDVGPWQHLLWSGLWVTVYATILGTLIATVVAAAPISAVSRAGASNMIRMAAKIGAKTMKRSINRKS